MQRSGSSFPGGKFVQQTNCRGNFFMIGSKTVPVKQPLDGYHLPA